MSDANGVISIVFKGEDGHTIMQSYNSQFQRIATLIEHGDDWKLLVGLTHEFNVKGAGCSDPIAFIEQIVSPPRYPKSGEMPINECFMDFISPIHKFEVYEYRE